MCDYSLHLVASRAAKVGDELVTTNFDNSLTRGFAAIEEPNVAVCLLGQGGQRSLAICAISSDELVSLSARPKRLLIADERAA
jgi:hypothetical protein